MSNKAKAIMDVEKAVADIEDKALASNEELEAIDLGLKEEDQFTLLAKERLRLVIDATILTARLGTAQGSLAANKSVGSETAVKQWQDQVDDIARQRIHTLRGIKDIDDKTRGAAKKKMQEIAERQRNLPDACPQCGRVLK